jgi:hypothetical protein
MRLFSSLLFLLLFVPSRAQYLKLSIESGLGSYSMTDLKDLNDYFSSNFIFDIKTVSNFPQYLFYRPAVLIGFLERNSVGPVYTFQSTGSRISAQDYSGNYRFDMKIHSNCPGIIYQYDVISKNNFAFSAQAEAGLNFSKLEATEILEVSDTAILNDSYVFESLNYHLLPRISAGYQYKQFAFSVSGGYLFQFGDEPLYTDNNKDHFLYNNGIKKTVKADWSGFRIGISLSYRLDLKNSTEVK